VGKVVALAGGLLLAATVSLGALGALVVGGTAGIGTGATRSTAGLAVPAPWEVLDRAAAGTCPGLAWSVLAAIGRVESDSGRVDLRVTGAEGPLQFEPSTFAAYATLGPGGAEPPSPYDAVDAVYTAAHLLCAEGANRPGGLAAALEAYDHSTVYVYTVTVLATALAAAPTLDAGAATALAFAAGQLGAPYRWGGTGPGGWDCSGLVQAAYRSAGVMLPRVAQGQFDAGPALPAGSAVAPGDLLFFGSSNRSVDHVGIYVGAGEMVDAPHTGAVVRVEAANWPDFVGATRPG
jgi:cell wall-associated NlpC family hydrolase